MHGIQKSRNNNDAGVSIIARLISAVAALTAVFIFLIGPLYLYRIFAGIPLGARGPSWEVWLLIIGGGIGAGVGRFVHIYLMTRAFGATAAQEQRFWGRHP